MYKLFSLLGPLLKQPPPLLDFSKIHSALRPEDFMWLWTFLIQCFWGRFLVYMYIHVKNGFQLHPTSEAMTVKFYSALQWKAYSVVNLNFTWSNGSWEDNIKISPICKNNFTYSGLSGPREAVIVINLLLHYARKILYTFQLFWLSGS
jgi:hypothetical protein